MFITVGTLSGNSEKKIMLLVSDASSLNIADTWLKDRFEARGYVVTPVSDEDSDLATQAVNYNMVWISASVDDTLVANDLLAVDVPIVVGEPLLWDDFNMMSGTLGSDSGETDIDIEVNSHAITSGLTLGLNTVMEDTETGRFYHTSNTTNLGSGVTRLAWSPDGGSSRPSLFLYNKGATLKTGTAANKRITWPLEDGDTDHVSDDGGRIGLTLLDRITDWALGLI